MKKLFFLLLLLPALLQAQTLKIKFRQIQPVGTQVILGRNTTGTGDIQALTPATVRTMLNVANGATNVTNNNQITNGAAYINLSQVPEEITSGSDNFAKTAITTYSGWDTRGGFATGIVLVTANTALTATARTVIVNPPGNITIEIPSASSYPGRELKFACYGSTTGYIIDLAQDYDELTGNTSSTYTVAATPGKVPQFFTLQSDGTSWFLTSNSN